MQNRKNLHILYLLCLFATLVVRSHAICDSLLLSLSNAGICEDGVCVAKELAQVKSSLDESSSFCFRIDQHEFGALDKTINFTVLDSWISYPLSNCYFTDDPQISVTGFCHCPLSGAVDCSNCPIPGITNGTNICNSGVNSGKGCFGAAGGTHCTVASLVGGNRYKICEIGEPSLEVYYKMFDTIGYKTGATKITELTTIKTTQANISFYDVNVKSYKRDDMIIIDLQNPQYVYVLPKDRINTIDTVEFGKLGWFRYNTTISPLLFNYITTSVASCSDDDFRFGIGIPQFRAILGNHNEWQLNNKIPGSIVSDPDVATVLGNEPIYDPPLPMLVQGGYFFGVDGIIYPFGLDLQGVPSILEDSWIYEGAMTTNKGGASGVFKCSEYIYMGYYDDAPTSPTIRNSYYLAMCVDTLDEGNWGVCRKLISTVFADASYTVATDCENPNFFAVRWPDYVAGTWDVQWNGANMLYFYATGSGSVPAYNTTSDRLITKSTGTSAKVDVEFLNVTIRFDVTNIHPDIQKIDYDDDYLYVWAASTNTKGTCLLTTSDDVTPSKLVEVSLATNKYKLPFKIRKFKGDIIVTLQCYKNIDTATFYIEVNKDNVDINFDTVKPNSVKVLSRDQSIFEKVSSAAGKVGSGIMFAWSYLFSITDNKIANFFIGIILTVCVIVGSMLSVYIFYKILQYIWCRMMNRWKLYRQKKMLPVGNKLNYRYVEVKKTA